jgi:hypothetical protein
VEIAAGKAIVLTGLAAMTFRLHSSAAEGAARDFDVVAQVAHRL